MFHSIETHDTRYLTVKKNSGAESSMMLVVEQGGEQNLALRDNKEKDFVN